jgi:hypothetical protein
MTVTKEGVTKIIPLFSTPINPITTFTVPKPITFPIPFSFNTAPRTGFGNLLSGLLVPKLKKEEGEGFVSASQIDILTEKLQGQKLLQKLLQRQKKK